MSEKLNKRDWKIIYSEYSGPEKKALELLSAEMGSRILRDTGVYTVHVLACERAENAVIDKNAVLLGTYGGNRLIREFVREEEIPENGYLVTVKDNLENPQYKLVVITAREAVNVFYAAVDFVDDCFFEAAPRRGPLRFTKELFSEKLPDYRSASAPKVKTRCVFTWGHPINDYRNYIDNMARLRLNQLIIWNDFVPINAREIIDYAHEYGIEIIWGYAWGWSRNCGDESVLQHLGDLKADIIRKYEEEYAQTGADGIYFQSFTEMGREKLGDRIVAEVVTEFVNDTAGALLQKYPNLRIQFGLHAMSVRERLSYLEKLDPRVSILWEDCGTFPYDYEPVVKSREAYDKTVEFTDKMLSLRDGLGCGMLYKGLMVMDWAGDHFVHQSGPFLMGMASAETVQHDREMMKPIWKEFQSRWMQNGHTVHEMTRYICKNRREEVTLGMAGQFAGGIWFPAALCAQILWDPDEPYETILRRVSCRASVDMV